MSDPLRAVFDTNVYVAATLSRTLTSPTRELLERLQQGQYALLTCDALADEVVEKLEDHAVAAEVIAQLMARLEKFAEWVLVPPEAIEPLLEDPDDNVVIACAVIGNAHYLVTYDPHFDLLGPEVSRHQNRQSPALPLGRARRHAPHFASVTLSAPVGVVTLSAVLRREGSPRWAPRCFASLSMTPLTVH